MAKVKAVELRRDLPERLELLFDPGSMQDRPDGSRRRIKASRHVGHPGENMTLCLRNPETFTRLNRPLSVGTLAQVVDCETCKRNVRYLSQRIREEMWDAIDIKYDSWDEEDGV